MAFQLMRSPIFSIQISFCIVWVSVWLSAPLNRTGRQSVQLWLMRVHAVCATIYQFSLGVFVCLWRLSKCISLAFHFQQTLNAKQSLVPGKITHWKRYHHHAIQTNSHCMQCVCVCCAPCFAMYSMVWSAINKHRMCTRDAWQIWLSFIKMNAKAKNRE